jgi:hypothetical protein
MASKKKLPWRTIVLTGDTGRFTWEQIHEAVRKTVEWREAREVRAARAAAKRNAESVSEEGEMDSTQKPWRTIAVSRHTGRFTRKQAEEAVRAVKEEGEREAAKSAEGGSRSGSMSTRKKPYAPIIMGGGSGRFTPEQVEAAVRAVREKRERKAARQAAKAAGSRRGPTLTA